MKPAASSLALVVGLVLLLFASACQSPAPKPGPAAAPPAASPEAADIQVSFPATTRAQPVDGRVVLLLAKRETADARQSDWKSLTPVYALLATNLAPGETIAFAPPKFRDPASFCFPSSLNALPAGRYYAQAVIDPDDRGGHFASAPGTLFSKTVPVDLEAGRVRGGLHLSADQVVPPDETPTDTEWVKFVEVRSERLSAFHGRETSLRAAAILPAGYAENPDREYPAVYLVPGFGGRHFGARGFVESGPGQRWRSGEWPYRAFLIYLDPQVPLGHSVFANSDNNGPVGEALVQELIPEIERRFRLAARPEGRVVTGHSSGGWSSLWLQVAYPEVFGGVWSTAPDPIDFRAFQTVNIYEDTNGHWTKEGYPRGLARDQQRILFTFPELNQWEYTTGPGFQLESFNAVFSPKGADGRPRPIMDRLTGEIDKEVAQAWRRYDIRLRLQENWTSLAPRLKGKIHVICGAWDTFYLNPAVELLRDYLAKTDLGGYVRLVPGDHGRLPDGMRDNIAREIGEHFRAHGFE